MAYIAFVLRYFCKKSESMGTILLIILAGVVLFVILGLLGWAVQALGFIGSLLSDGITGCIGCICHFFWVILLIIIALALIF